MVKVDESPFIIYNLNINHRQQKGPWKKQMPLFLRRGCLFLQKAVFKSLVGNLLKEVQAKMKFVADSMLGKLAKWLRVLGYDTLYRSSYRPGEMEQLMKEDRLLLSRHGKAVNPYGHMVLLHADRAGAQLIELRDRIDLPLERSKWFTRCLICNGDLIRTQPDEVRDHLPEYVFYHHLTEIRFCASCGKYYWPGSHRARMVHQLRKWGFV